MRVRHAGSSAVALAATGPPGRRSHRVAQGQHVHLDWTLPRKNTDGTLIKHIPQARICRREGTALMSTCSAVATVPTPLANVPPKKKGQQESPSTRMQYADELPLQLGEQDPAGFARYAVEILNNHGRTFGMSNQVLIPLAPTIPPPDELAADVRGDGVHISWTGAAPAKPPAGLVYRYRIMRKPVGAPAYLAVADIEPSERGSYLDKTFEWEQKYDYRMTTVTLVQVSGVSAAVEGDDSQPVEVYTRDIFPPAQPGGLQAVFSSIGQKPFVDLTWAPNTEGDLAGYNIFRHVEGGQPQKLNQQPLPVPSFRDGNVEPGTTYIYSVSAVDLRGNESPRSSEAKEAVPNKW